MKSIIQSLVKKMRNLKPVNQRFVKTSRFLNKDGRVILNQIKRNSEA